MCQSINRPLPSLPCVDCVLLWTMRAWVMGITQKIPVEEQIRDAFAKIGAPGAASQLFGFMWVLGQRANRQLAVDCVCNPRISDDERALLEILALYQQGRSFEAMIVLRSMVDPKSAQAAAESAQSVAAALTAARRFLSAPALSTRQYAFALDRTLAANDSVRPRLH